MMTEFDFNPDGIDVPHGHFIAGRLHADTQSTLAVRRPSDGLVYATLPDGDESLVDFAVRDCKTALAESGWGNKAPRERARVLQKWAALIEDEAEPLAHLEAVGSTRPVRDVGMGDVPYCADVIRFFAELCDKQGGEIGETAKDHLGLIISEPYGVVGAIAPWNFPLIMAVWKIAPALAAGNAVVLKPSELTPFSANYLAILAVRAGLPAGLFNVVQGKGDTVGRALCHHPQIAKISFTGSSQTGAKIMTACAQAGTKPVTLELGGKSPQIVFEDAPDLAVTSKIIAKGIVSNAGQVCVAGSRLIVHEAIAEPLIRLISDEFHKLAPGPTWSGTTSLPPLVSETQCARIETLVNDAISRGAEPLTGGQRLATMNTGAFYAPTLLDRVNPEMRVVHEEVFGPVLTIQRFRTDDEAFSLASHPTYGLAAGVHTQSFDRAMKAIRQLSAGNVWVNRYGRSADHIMPTGGFGLSGFGKDLGRQAFDANRRLKSVLMAFPL